MTAPQEIFPNIAKLALARDLCYFLDWVLEVHGAQLSRLETGQILDAPGVVAEFVEIDHAKLGEEMLRLEQVIQQERQGFRRVN